MLKFIKNERGGALLIALMLVIMLSLLGIFAVRNSDTDIDLSFNNQHTEKSFYIAEAGAKRAYAQLLDSTGWSAGYGATSYNGGTYAVRLVDSLGDSTLFDTLLIQSVGDFNQTRSAVELTCTPEYIYPFHYAMFAGTSIYMDKNTCTDSYNSDSGTYAATVLDSMGDIGSNGTIGTSKDVDIGGSANVATPGGITLGVNNTVTGDTSSTADTVDLDIIPQSEYDWAKANSNALSGLSGTNFSYNNGTKKLTAGAGGNIIMQSGVYYFSEIYLDQGSTITLAAGASVTIYITGDITFCQNSTTNAGGQPSDLMIWSKGNLDFNQYNIFHGTFYSPNAHIQYDQTSQVYGSIVGNTIQLDQGACFHYDRSLAKVTHGTTGHFYIVAWKEF